MTSKTMWVKAAPLKDPAFKGKARVYKKGGHLRMIDEFKPLEVSRSDSYYVRKINLKELIECNKDGSPLGSKPKATPARAPSRITIAKPDVGTKGSDR